MVNWQNLDLIDNNPTVNKNVLMSLHVNKWYDDVISTRSSVCVTLGMHHVLIVAVNMRCV